MRSTKDSWINKAADPAAIAGRGSFTTVYQPFRARAILWHGLFEFAGWRLRTYAVVSPERSFNLRLFDVGVVLAMKAVPQFDASAGRPGVGVLIRHQGPTVDYVVLGWWDQQNELPVRVFVRAATGWRPANVHESFCVWDLEILWHERNLWLETALGGTQIDVGAERYLRADPILKEAER